MGLKLCAFFLTDLPTHADMLPRFARPVPQLCMISNEIMNFIYETQHYCLRSFDQLWLSPENLQNYADVIHAKGAPLSNCRGCTQFVHYLQMPEHAFTNQ